MRWGIGRLELKREVMQKEERRKREKEGYDGDVEKGWIETEENDTQGGEKQRKCGKMEEKIGGRQEREMER